MRGVALENIKLGNPEILKKCSASSDKIHKIQTTIEGIIPKNLSELFPGHLHPKNSSARWVAKIGDEDIARSYDQLKSDLSPRHPITEWFFNTVPPHSASVVDRKVAEGKFYWLITKRR